MMRLISLLILTSSLLYSGLAFAEEEETEKKKAVYFSLTPSLIANVHGKARYAKCDIQLLVEDEESLAGVQMHATAIRHELLLLMSDQKGSDLQDQKGKERFRQTALSAVGSVVKAQTGKNSIKDLFFTSFFVQ
jgi:flagellar FliL protein